MPRSIPSVVLVGRPNVGKSTLFNRLTRSRRAIVTPVPGTTRDVIAQPVEWEGVRFQLIDTGGMFGASEDPLHELVLARGQRAMAAADLLVLVVDGREGLVPADEQVAQAVRATNHPVVLAVNKSDDRRAGPGSLEFHALGFEPLVRLSAEHGEGVGDLLDVLVERLPRQGSRCRAAAGRIDEADETVSDDGDGSPGEETADRAPAPAEVGGRDRGASERRQVLAREPVAARGADDRERRARHDARRRRCRAHLASPPVPHRRYRGHPPARSRQPRGQVEAVSVLLARRSIEAADVVVLVIDAAAGATDQDAAIAGEADRAGRGVIIAVNKWDLMKGQGPSS
jgi:GTPase